MPCRRRFRDLRHRLILRRVEAFLETPFSAIEQTIEDLDLLC